MLRAEWLESFIAFAEHLSFTHAARALHLSQPALFVQIAKLSEALQVTVYEKRGRQLALTDAGVELLAFARDARQRSAELVTTLRTGVHQSSVTLAAGTGAFLYLLGPGIRDFMRSSTARLRLLHRDRAGTLEAVRRGEAQLGVAAFDALPDDLASQLLTRVPQLLVVPQRHRLARKRVVKLADLQGEALIVSPVGSPQRATLAQALDSAEVQWRVAVEATGWELVLRFAELGVGLAVVNGFCRIPRGLVTRPLGELPRVAYYIVERRASPPSDAVAELRHALRSALPGELKAR
jgi:LysR family transcriptional regulator, low CO2-responsive transcriptional regulator